jgi:outer membrane immunogenic protein
MKTRWDASLRGRFGVLLTPVTLAYATGGVAWQHSEVTSTCGSPICEVTPGANGFTPAIITHSITKPGWTIGGGLEIALQEHWLARAEYRYADFGAPSFIIARSSIRPLFNPSIDTFDVRMRTHTATFGVAYKFN